MRLTPEIEALKQAAESCQQGGGSVMQIIDRNADFAKLCDPATILALIAQLEAQAVPPETMSAKLDRLQGGKARHIAGLCANAGQQVTFDRRWSLARDGFGLQRNDESGEYVSHDDAVAVLHTALARPVQAVPDGWISDAPILERENRILATLRNPWGLSVETRRYALNAAADLIEAKSRDYRSLMEFAESQGVNCTVSNDVRPTQSGERV